MTNDELIHEIYEVALTALSNASYGDKQDGNALYRLMVADIKSLFKDISHDQLCEVLAIRAANDAVETITKKFNETKQKDAT